MAQSHYSGTVKLLGVPYTRTSEKHVTDAGGCLECPKCKKSIFLKYVDEHIQLGFDGYHQYQEFFWCEKCDKGFCIVTVRKNEVYFG